MISAVNGNFGLGNNYCFRYRVKLNNPLMGTETSHNSQAERFKKSSRVKLNNPLMGTETKFHFLYPFVLNHFNVKLNNPLMGTETCQQFH